MADKTIKELLADYNAVAVQAGVPKLKGWKGSGAKLGQRTAMLRARPRKVAGAAKGNGKQAKVPIYVRTCELLCEVTHVEDKRKPSGPDNVKRKGSLPPGQERSVGMSYGDVLKKVPPHRRLPFTPSSIAVGLSRATRWWC